MEALISYLWPAIIIFAKSLAFLVGLLVLTAYILYADRKIFAAVQLRRGPNVIGPWGLLLRSHAAVCRGQTYMYVTSACNSYT